MPAECSVGAKPCVPFSCLTHLLEDQAKRIPDAPAILAVGRAPLTYAGLYQHINKTRRTLRAMGSAQINWTSSKLLIPKRLKPPFHDGRS